MRQHSLVKANTALRALCTSFIEHKKKSRQHPLKWLRGQIKGLNGYVAPHKCSFYPIKNMAIKKECSNFAL